VSNAKNFNYVLISMFEEETIMAASQPEPRLGRLKFLYVAIASSEKSIDTMQNLERSFAIDSTEVRTSFDGPND
jgi:hypothetical protein